MYLTKLEPNKTQFAESIILVPLVGGPENGQLEIPFFLVYKTPAKRHVFFWTPIFQKSRACFLNMYLTKLEPNNTPFEKHLIWVPLVGGPENGQLEILFFLVYKTPAKRLVFLWTPIFQKSKAGLFKHVLNKAGT